MHNKLTLNQQF
jgi:hypothetical protein